MRSESFAFERRRVRLPAALSLACAAAFLAAAPRAFATDDESAEGPAPTTAAETKGSMDRMLVPVDKPVVVMPGPNEWFPVQSAFVRDTKVDLNLRTYYLLRDKFDPSFQEAWAIGGALNVKSGYLCDRVAIGIGAYASLPIYAPDDRDGTLLLQPGQEGYLALGQLYAEAKLGRGIVADVGAKEYNTPYINKNDNRMSPNTFEAATVVGRHGGEDGCPEIVWGGGYFTRIKERNEDAFVSMSDDAGVKSVERGVAVVAGKYSTKTWSAGAAEYYCDDVINIFYAEGSWKAPMQGCVDLKFSGQFTDQRSTGSELLTGSSFSTQQLGFKADASYRALMGTVAYTHTADDSDMRNPWSSCPGYTSVQVEDFNRAGEQAALVKASVDLCKAVGIPGTSVYALWVHGWDRVDGVNEDEVDLDLQWRPAWRNVEGLSLRFRYAYVAERDGASDTLTDFRVIVNYDIELR